MQLIARSTRMLAPVLAMITALGSFAIYSTHMCADGPATQIASLPPTTWPADIPEMQRQMRIIHDIPRLLDEHFDISGSTNAWVLARVSPTPMAQNEVEAGVVAGVTITKGKLEVKKVIAGSIADDFNAYKRVEEFKEIDSGLDAGTLDPFSHGGGLMIFSVKNDTGDDRIDYKKAILLPDNWADHVANACDVLKQKGDVNARDKSKPKSAPFAPDDPNPIFAMIGAKRLNQRDGGVTVVLRCARSYPDRYEQAVLTSMAFTAACSKKPTEACDTLTGAIREIEDMETLRSVALGINAACPDDDGMILESALSGRGSPSIGVIPVEDRMLPLVIRSLREKWLELRTPGSYAFIDDLWAQ